MITNNQASPVVLTLQDHERLSALSAGRNGRFADVIDFLEQELDRASIVEPTGVPPNIVTMNSRVVVRAAGSDELQTFTLVYPAEADISVGNLSILTPAGAALIGLARGSTAEWVTRDGQTKTMTVVEIQYQPEADGRFDL